MDIQTYKTNLLLMLLTFFSSSWALCQGHSLEHRHYCDQPSLEVRINGVSGLECWEGQVCHTISPFTSPLLLLYFSPILSICFLYGISQLFFKGLLRADVPIPSSPLLFLYKQWIILHLTCWFDLQRQKQTNNGVFLFLLLPSSLALQPDVYSWTSS